MFFQEHLEHARYKAEKVREKEVLLGWDPSDFEKLTEAGGTGAHPRRWKINEQITAFW